MELSTPFNITEDGGQTVLVAKGQGANYTTAEDFSGLQIGAQNGSLQYNLVSSQLPEDVEIVPVGSLNDGVLMLETRQDRRAGLRPEQRRAAAGKP